MGDQLSAGSFIVYSVDNVKSQRWLLWKKMRNNALLTSFVILVIGLFFIHTDFYRIVNFLWIGVAVFGAIIGIFQYHSIFFSAVHPLRVVVQDGEIHFIDFRKNQLEFKVVPESGFSVHKKSLGDGRVGYHLLTLEQPDTESRSFLFRMRKFGNAWAFNFRPAFRDFEDDLQKIGVTITK